MLFHGKLNSQFSVFNIRTLHFVLVNILGEKQKI